MQIADCRLQNAERAGGSRGVCGPLVQSGAECPVVQSGLTRHRLMWPELLRECHRIGGAEVEGQRWLAA